MNKGTCSQCSRTDTLLKTFSEKVRLCGLCHLIGAVAFSFENKLKNLKNQFGV